MIGCAQSRLAQLLGVAAATCPARTCPAKDEYAGKKTHNAVVVAAGLGAEHRSLPALDRELRARGYSPLGKNNTLLHLGGGMVHRRFGVYASIEVALPATTMGSSRGMELRQATYEISTSWLAYQLGPFAAGPEFGMYTRELWFANCRGRNGVCPSERLSAGVDASIRLQVRVGRPRAGLGWLVGSSLGYRWEALRGEWRRGALAQSQPESNTSGVVTQLFVGLWVPQS